MSRDNREQLTRTGTSENQRVDVLVLLIIKYR
jgi:hypothetical protein